MRIGIELSRNDFMYDVHSLVKSFYPEGDVAIYTAEETEKTQEDRDLLFRVAIPEYGEGQRKDVRDLLKQEIYRTLTDMTGTSLPWGMLSGIRPTKIPMKMLKEGSSREEILARLMEYAYVSAGKAELALAVAEKELGLLEKLSLPEDSFSLYLHIPFCPSICSYCTFSSNPVHAYRQVLDAYLTAMLQEMEETRDRLAREGKCLSPTTVYIGGGTPTVLSETQLERVLEGISKVWDLQRVQEITVEAGRPDSFTKEKLAVLKAKGVGRISVNPQSMNDETLKRIGRSHTAADTEAAFRMARDAGFDNINMDIILGLPGEGAGEWQRTLGRIRALAPDSLTVHSLALKRASRLNQRIREAREAGEALPEAEGTVFEEAGSLMEMAAETAALMSMEPYYLYRQKNMRGNLENTGFARAGKESLYNILIMEEVQTIYAFGAGASTKTVYPDGRIERVISPKDLKTYMERRRGKISS